jgi:hypothetical protein
MSGVGTVHGTVVLRRRAVLTGPRWYSAADAVPRLSRFTRRSRFGLFLARPGSRIVAALASR